MASGNSGLADKRKASNEAATAGGKIVLGMEVYQLPESRFALQAAVKETRRWEDDESNWTAGTAGTSATEEAVEDA